MMKWVRNTRGKPDAMLTFSVVAFFFVILKLLVSGVSVQVAGHSVDFGKIDASVIAAMLTPTLGAYVARRHSETKYGPDSQQGDDDDKVETAHGSKEA